MQVINIIRQAIPMAGLTGKVDADIDSSGRAELVSCTDAVYNELVLQYIPLKTRENITFNNKQANLFSFSHPVREILEIKKPNGQTVDFTVYPFYVEADVEGKALVTYLYSGGELSVMSAVFLPPQFNATVMAFGVVSEYFYRKGLPEEASYYRSRFDQAVQNILYQRRSAKLPARKFL